MESNNSSSHSSGSLASKREKKKNTMNQSLQWKYVTKYEKLREGVAANEFVIFVTKKDNELTLELKLAY